MLDSESFYLSGSVANLNDYGEQRHSETSTHGDCDAIRDQLLVDHEEDSERGRSISPSPRDEGQKNSAAALAPRNYNHDYSRNSDQPSESSHSSSARSEAPAPTGRPHRSFYARPRERRIYMEGIFRWYRSEGNKPIDSPPSRSQNNTRNTFQEADVVVHEVLQSDAVQVWCWTNDNWMAITPGHEREIYGKTYVFAFAKNSYKPCWVTSSTLTRRNWD